MSEDPKAVCGTRRAFKEMSDGTIRVSVDIDPDFRDAFLKLFTQIDMRVAIAPLLPEHEVAARQTKAATAASPQERSFAHRLHAIGYFRDPKLWRAMHDYDIYTLQEHKRFIEGQPCVIPACVHNGDVVLHHVAMANLPAAGRRLQPEAPNKVPHWYGVPACHAGHNFVHSKECTLDGKHWLLEKAIAFTAEQCKQQIKDYLGVTSFTDVTREMLQAFEDDVLHFEGIWRRGDGE